MLNILDVVRMLAAAMRSLVTNPVATCLFSFALRFKS